MLEVPLRRAQHNHSTGSKHFIRENVNRRRGRYLRFSLVFGAMCVTHKEQTKDMRNRERRRKASNRPVHHSWKPLPRPECGHILQLLVGDPGRDQQLLGVAGAQPGRGERGQGDTETMRRCAVIDSAEGIGMGSYQHFAIETNERWAVI